MEIEGLGFATVCDDADRFDRDIDTDRLIGECLDSEEYTNEVFSYFYDCRHWPIRIIHNPNGEKLQFPHTTAYTAYYGYSLISKEVLPSELENHLKKLVKEHLGEGARGFVSIASTTSIGGTSSPDFDLFEHLKPVKKEPDASSKPSKSPTIFDIKPISIPKPYPFQYDEKGDLKISECLKSKEFTNVTFSYSYGDQQYEIRVLNNPPQELLWGEGMISAVRWPSVVTANQALPLHLESHLKDVALKAAKDTIIDLENTRKYLPQVYASMHPVKFSNEIDNPLFDTEIREIFASNQLINRVFHYQLEGKIISVRIIHNPEKNTLSWTRTFQESFGKFKTFTLNWTNKYGLFFNEKAPQALVDHLSQLVPSSWWDWVFNFKIYNGTPVTFTEVEHHGSYNTKTTYTTTSWFDFTRDISTI